MHISTFIIISIFQLIHSNSDSEEEEDEYQRWSVWDPHGALIQTQGMIGEKHFPYTVRKSSKYRKKVYYDYEEDITFAMCPNPDTRNNLGRYCNFGESFTTSRYADEDLDEICEDTVEPAMGKVHSRLMRNHLNCANGGQRYKFVYYRCKEEDRSFLKKTLIYDTCYNRLTKQLVYGYYMIVTPSLLRNRYLKGEREFEFNFQSEPFFHEHFADHFRLVSANLYRTNRAYVPRMVLPPEFLPFALMRKPLFHYMNVAPMHPYLLPIWEYVMINLQIKISWFNRSVNIVAGLMGALQDEDGDTIYLGHTRPPPAYPGAPVNPIPEIPIPHTWWLLIYNKDKDKGVVIMMINKPYEDYMEDNFHDDRNCNADMCADANVLEALPDRAQYSYYIYCCRPYAVTNLYGIDGRNGLLELPNL